MLLSVHPSQEVTEDGSESLWGLLEDPWLDVKSTEADMGNSPTDKSKDFIKKGMTLITQLDSDRLLKKSKEKQQKDKDT